MPVFCGVFLKSSPRYSLVHILPTSSSTHLSFFTHVKHVPVQIELLLQSCHFLSSIFADRGLQPWKQRPYFGDPRSHTTRKNKMQPTNTNVHTYVNGTGCRNTWICSHVEHFCETVCLNSLVRFSRVTIPVHRRLWNMEEGGMQSVECGV